MAKLPKLVSLLVAVVLVPQSARPHDLSQVAGAEWQRYKVDGGEFSVSLPFTPAMNTNHVEYERNQTRREQTLATYNDGVVYVIEAYEKKGISFDNLIQQSGRCTPTEDITVDGVAGKSCKGDNDTAKVEALLIQQTSWASRFFATKTNLYKFGVVAAKIGDHSAAISNFFASISFRKDPEGVVVSDGPGVQPLSVETPPQTDSVFRGKELTERARLVNRPEPQYTESARRNQVTGTVVLRAVFSKSGAVENITVLAGLPDGLTDKAIMAARQMRFIPAIKDGRFVSMYMQLEYNFNLY